MSNIIYVAISKETGSIMSGQNGQYAFGDETTLAKSVGYAYGYTAKKKGVKAKELYYIKEIHVDALPQGESKPFVVKETHGADYNDQERLELEVDGVQAFSIGCLSECPEDASLERDLYFVHDIKNLLAKAHKAGQEGRPFVYESEDEEEEE